MFDTIVVGDYCFDLIITGLPALPVLGQELFGTGCTVLPGGAYNTIVAMHRLGLKAGWANDFGHDDLSQFVLDHARHEGLDESLFTFHNHSLRRITVAASFPEERAFISYVDPGPAIPAGFKALLTKSARALYIPGLYYGRWFEIGAKIARLKGMAIVMDGNSSHETLADTPSLARILTQIDLFMPNKHEACRLTGKTDVLEAMKELMQLCPLVVIKAGSDGAYGVKSGQIIHKPALPVTPVETTGAGDCFNAGFIKGWLSGIPLETCLQWGNIVGGLSTLSQGGTGQVTHQEDIEEWLTKA